MFQVEAKSHNQTPAQAELSEHLHRSVSAMTRDELRAFTDALADAFLSVDDISRVARLVAGQTERGANHAS